MVAELDAELVPRGPRNPEVRGRGRIDEAGEDEDEEAGQDEDAEMAWGW